MLPMFRQKPYNPDIILFNGKLFSNPDSIAYFCIAPITATKKGPIDIPKLQSEIAVDFGVAVNKSCMKGRGPINKKLTKAKIYPIIMA